MNLQFCQFSMMFLISTEMKQGTWLMWPTSAEEQLKASLLIGMLCSGSGQEGSATGDFNP